MSETASQVKAALRTKVQERLGKMTAEEIRASSENACKLLAGQPHWKKAAAILFHAPLPKELDLWPLLLAAISAGKTVALPRFEPQSGSYEACRIQNPLEDICIGKYGIREPLPKCAKIALNRLDFVLVPGVAFDMDGHRLGRGRGFYDRLLEACPGLTCGTGFDQQVVEAVPVEPHDVRLDCILTPTRWHEVTRRRTVLK